MSLGVLLLLHLMAGAGVAGAVYLSGRGRHGGVGFLRVATALVFWPLYLPILLAGNTSQEPPAGPEDPAPSGTDELGNLIGQVNAELDGALNSLDGWAEGVLARERGRLQELRTALAAQADRIRAMDRLLNRPEYAGLADGPLPGEADGEIAARLRSSRDLIRRNLDRLGEIRRRNLHDLLGTLAWVRELASMMHLAKFSGAPASSAEELVAQIAAAVEGLPAVSGPLESEEPPGAFPASARQPALSNIQQAAPAGSAPRRRPGWLGGRESTTRE
jgi:hypothetical protein